MKRDEDKEGREAQRLWRLSAMGSELAFGIIGMVLVGLGIDYFFGTGPKGVIICTILGVLASGYNFIRQALELNRRSSVPRRPGEPARPPALPAEPKSETSEKKEEPDVDLEFPPDFDRY